MFVLFLQIMQVWYQNVQHVKDINTTDVLKASSEFS